MVDNFYIDLIKITNNFTSPFLKKKNNKFFLDFGKNIILLSSIKIFYRFAKDNERKRALELYELINNIDIKNISESKYVFELILLYNRVCKRGIKQGE